MLAENAIGRSVSRRESKERKGSRKERGGRARKAHGGMFRANRRDSAPASIPRSSRQISTDEFPASCIPLRRVLSWNFSLVFPSSSIKLIGKRDYFLWESAGRSKINCYFLSFDTVSERKKPIYLETHEHHPISSRVGIFSIREPLRDLSIRMR